LVDRADDERVDRRSVRQPARCHRALRDQHPLAGTAAQHVKCDQTITRADDFDLEEGPIRQAVDPLGRPDVADHRSLQHHRSLSIGTPSARALSFASGVSTARGPSTRLAPAAAAAATARSVTAPLSTRCAARARAAAEAVASPASLNLTRRAIRSGRILGLSASRSTRSANSRSSASVSRRTTKKSGGGFTSLSETAGVLPAVPSESRRRAGVADAGSPAGTPDGMPPAGSAEGGLDAGPRRTCPESGLDAGDAGSTSASTSPTSRRSSPEVAPAKGNSVMAITAPSRAARSRLRWPA